MITLNNYFHCYEHVQFKYIIGKFEVLIANKAFIIGKNILFYYKIQCIGPYVNCEAICSKASRKEKVHKKNSLVLF